MVATKDIVKSLIAANHVLHFNNVLDAYGHISVRNPDNSSTFFLSRDLAPALVSSADDFVEYLVENAQDRDSIVLAAYEQQLPIFCPAFSDCSAGFGLVAHQHARGDQPKVSIDSVKDFYELTQLKIKNLQAHLPHAVRCHC